MSKTAPTLEYSQLRRPLMTVRQWLIIAVVCGALPLTVGLTTTLVYLVTYIRNLELFGVFVAATGLLIVTFGGVAWLIWVLKTREFSSRRWWLKTAGALLLLLANFPACLACIYAAEHSRFTVTNAGATPLTVGISATFAGQTRALGAIEPGGRKRFYWRIDPNGDEFNVTAATPAGPATSTFYVDLNGIGGGADVDLAINPDGSIRVK